MLCNFAQIFYSHRFGGFLRFIELWEGTLGEIILSSLDARIQLQFALGERTSLVDAWERSTGRSF